jgi:DNA-binding response OmpR family regulator
MEEQEDVREPVQGRLEYEGFTVVSAPDLDAAQNVIAAERPDLVILGVHLPVIEELEICRRLRREAGMPHLPILLLSGRGDPVDLVVAAENGFNDFITRPFELPELVVRVKVLLKRAAQNRPPQILKAGSVELDRDLYQVTVDSEPIGLTTKEFELLSVLMEAEGRVVRREVLLEQVWSYEMDAGVESRTLDVHIRSLRKKLGREGARIVTVRSVGYRISLSPDWIRFGSEASSSKR